MISILAIFPPQRDAFRCLLRFAGWLEKSRTWRQITRRRIGILENSVLGFFPPARFCESHDPAACFGTGATTKMSSYVIEYRLCVETSSSLVVWLDEDTPSGTIIPRIHEKERLSSERSVKPFSLGTSMVFHL